MSEATPHIPKEKMLNAMLDPKAALADAEMEHLLNCGECMQVLGDLVLPDD